MGRARSAAVAALAGSLIIAGGTPAHTDGEPPAVVSTGLTPGRLIGSQTRLHPVPTGTGTDDKAGNSATSPTRTWPR